ncbi:FAD-dependent oxidoreductase [Vibrio harveyi]|nr:FAD-dependent oxidoreductase [Vibrio harveyi]
MMQMTYDVIIIGGGPAGAACALAMMTHHNKSVLLLERGDFTAQRIGEQVTSSVFDFLDYLKLNKSDFPDGCFGHNYGKTSLWGSNVESPHESIFTPQTTTYQLNREAFDETLLMAVVNQGGMVIPRCQPMDVVNDGNGWQVETTHPTQGVVTFSSEYIVDASGRNTNLGKKLGIQRAQYDQLVAIGAFIQRPNRQFEQRQFIESCESGWWYCAGLSKDLAVVTYFTDMKLVKSNRLNRVDNWSTQLKHTHKISSLVQGSQSMHSKLWIKQASSEITSSSYPNNYIAIGDAAASYDPISSMGLGFALSSACHGAHALMEGTREVHKKYQASSRVLFNQYLQIRADIYRREHRWLNSPFWKERQRMVLCD